MKIKLLIPFYGDILESKYLEQGIYPYNSPQEQSWYRIARISLSVVIVGAVYNMLFV